MSPCVQAKANDRGSTADNRKFIEAVLWIVCTGRLWWDLPREFGKWDSVFQRYRRWFKAGRFTRIFAEISDKADTEYAMVDDSIVKVHCHSQSAKGGTLNQVIGKSKGGITPQILALVGTFGQFGRISPATHPGNVMTFAGLNLFRTCS